MGLFKKQKFKHYSIKSTDLTDTEFITVLKYKLFGGYLEINSSIEGLPKSIQSKFKEEEYEI